MGLLEEYSYLISNINNLADEIPELREQLRSYEKMKSQYQRERSNLDIEQSRQQTSLISEELNRLTSEEYNRINQKQAAVDSKLHALVEQHKGKLKSIASKKYTDKLSRKYSILAKLEATVQKYNLPENLPPELLAMVSDHLAETEQTYSEKALLTLIDDVHKAYGEDGMITFDSEGKLSTLIDFFTLKQLNDSSMHNRTKLYVYFGYLLALVVGCFTFPVIPITCLGVAGLLTYKQYATDNKRWIEFILPYSSLKNGLAYLNNDIRKRVSEYQAKDTDIENKQYQESTYPLNQERSQLEIEYAQAAENVRSSISPSELQERVKAQFEEQIAQCEKDIANAERCISRTQKFIHSNEQQIPKLKDKQKEMLSQIKELYLNPTQPGTSRRLVKSFFLGIDDAQGTLIEFKFDGMATLIMYKGDNCRTNKDLISMMLMQLLSSMSLTSLSVYLADLRSAGLDYAVFFQPELSGKLHLCATDYDVGQAISSLHAELIMRRQDILTEAETLEQYNETMLARKSLPREYIFFFLQDPSPKDMEKQELQQLLNNGPAVGIIPIIFLRHTDIVNGFDASKDSANNIIPFFQAFGQYSFTFDGISSDLTYTPDLSTTIISMLKKGNKANGNLHNR